MKVVCILDRGGVGPPGINTEGKQLSATVNLSNLQTARKEALDVIKRVCKRYVFCVFMI